MYEDVIQQIKSGNLEPLDKIYLEHKSAFITYARANFSQLPFETVEDSYQDTIIDVYKSITSERLTSIEYSFKNYIFHIGKTKLIRAVELERKQRTVNISATDDTLIYESTIDDNIHDVDKIISFVFSNASSACQQILKMFYYEKKSMSEIAQVLGYSNADTVKAKKNRCLNQLVSKAAGVFNGKI